MSFFIIPGGIRKIPAALQASGACYSTSLHNFLQHNQELIQGTIISRQLVNDYFPSSGGGVAYGQIAPPSGSMVAQWGRFEHRPGTMITARAWAAKDTTTYSDDSSLILVCTPKLANPNTQLSRLVESLENTLHLATVTLDAGTYSHHIFTVLPNVQKGKFFYLSLWKQSADPGGVDSSQFFLRFFSVYEEPEQ